MDEQQLAQWLRDNPDLRAENARIGADVAFAPKAPRSAISARDGLVTKVTRQSGGNSHLENAFVTLWMQLGGPELETEYRFHGARRWRADFAHVAAAVLIEVEGGTRQYGRHNRHDGYRNDCEKYNAAQHNGWRVYRLTSDMLTPEHLEPSIGYIKTAQSSDN